MDRLRGETSINTRNSRNLRLSLARLFMSGVLLGAITACREPNPLITDADLTALCDNLRSGHANELFPYIESDGNLHLIDQSGNKRRLTNDPNSFDSDFALSPDKTKVSFVRLDNTAPRDSPKSTPPGLFIVNTDGTELRQLAISPRNSEDTDFSWSVDNNNLTFVRNTRKLPGTTDTGLYSLYGIDAQGKNLRLLFEVAENSGQILNPQFSPDGSWIAFSYSDSTYVIGNDGANLTKISAASSEPGQGRSFYHKWLPNSKQMLVGKEFAADTEHVVNIYLVSRDGWQSRDVTSICRISESD